MAKIKVMLASLKAGAGHDALRDFLYQQMKQDTDFKLTKFDHPSLTFEKTNSKVHLYKYLHEFTYFYSPRLLGDIFMWFTPQVAIDCYKAIKKEKPDLIIATHFALAMHFAMARNLFKQKPMVITCIPDYGTPSKTQYPRFKLYRADKIMVFEKWTQEGTIQSMSLPPEDVLLGGFNPRKEFLGLRQKYQSKQNALQKLKACFNYFPYTDIDPKKISVLVTAGSSYAQVTEPLLKDLARMQADNNELLSRYQFFVICGTNHGLFASLTAKNKKFRHWSNIFPFSWIDPEIYAMLQFGCDFPILGSIAPATLNELLEAECGPLIIYKTRPGQEVPHIAFIQERGLGEYLPEEKDVIAKLIKGISAEEKEVFLKRGSAFRAEQQERANLISSQIKQVYAEYIQKNSPKT